MCKARALWINNESKQGPFELIRALVSKSRALLVLFVRNVKIWLFIRLWGASGVKTTLLASQPPSLPRPLPQHCQPLATWRGQKRRRLRRRSWGWKGWSRWRWRGQDSRRRSQSGGQNRRWWSWEQKRTKETMLKVNLKHITFQKNWEPNSFFFPQIDSQKKKWKPNNLSSPAWSRWTLLPHLFAKKEEDSSFSKNEY